LFFLKKEPKTLALRGFKSLNQYSSFFVGQSVAFREAEQRFLLLFLEKEELY
jgi:hypothetical protein